MKKIVFSLFAAGLLAACGRSEAPGTTGQVAAPAEAGAPTHPHPVRAPDDQRGIDLLEVAGVEFDFPNKVRYDILDTSRGGTRRHRVLVEILGGNFDDVTQKFENSLVHIGYRKSSESVKDGRVQQVFKQAGKPTYYVLMQPAGVGPKLSSPDSAGSIHVMWNITD